MSKEQGSSKVAIILICVLLAGVGGFFGAKHYITAQVKQDIDANLAKIKEYKDIDVRYKGLEVDLFSRQATLKDVTLKARNVNLDVQSVSFADSPDFERKIALKAKGVGFDYSSLDPDVKNILGLNAQSKFDLAYDVEFDPKFGEMNLKKLEIDLPKAFRLELSCKVANVPAASLNENPLTLLVMYREVLLAGFKLKYRDAGALENALAQQAAKVGQPAQAVREQTIAKMEQDREGFKSRGEVLEYELAGAALAMLREGKGVSLEAAPETPVKIGFLLNLRSEADVVQALRLSIGNF